MDDNRVFHEYTTVLAPTQLAFTCSKLTMETPEQCVIYVQS